MSPHDYRLLPWDSDFLGIAVARIAPQIGDEKSVTRVLRALRAAGVRLAYWQPPLAEPLSNFARAAGASYVGTHVRYERSTDQAASPIGMESCLATSAELEALSIAAGALSRFALDPKMPPGTAERLYTLWMRESFGGAMGDEVLAARDASGLSGMITLKFGQEGAIGLVAVAARARGAGIGQALVQAATARFAARGLARASVVTQGENRAACRLYERCGYRLAESSLTAHFWL